MTYEDIFKWAKEKIENKKIQDSFKIGGLLIKIENNYAERELILECCPRASHMPMTEVNSFTYEEYLKLKDKFEYLKEGVQEEIQKIVDNAQELKESYNKYYEHYSKMVENGKRGLLSWRDINYDTMFQYDNMGYKFKNFLTNANNLLEKLKHIGTK